MHMDYGNNDNWDIYIEQTKRRPAHFLHTYTVLVTDANFKN